MPRVFTRRLVLSGLEETPDGAGGTRHAWLERGALWAEVRMRSGALAASEFGRTPRLQVRITTHELPEGHPMRPALGDRLRDGLRTFEVQAVHSGERRFLVVLANEVPAAELQQ